MGKTIEFLQTGGVPLTNDLLNSLQSGFQIFEGLADLCGNLTIVSGCETNGSTVSPGIVAIEGTFYEFEGGSGSTVYIHTENQEEIFEDSISKVLVVSKTVRFGNATIVYQWSDFVRLKTIKQIQAEMSGFATQPDLNALITEIELLKKKTAPIINGGVVWVWQKPASDIPAGWKECIDLRGKVVVGLDPSQPEFSQLWSEYGEKTHALHSGELPNIQGTMYTIAPDWDFGSGVISATNANKAFIVGGNSSYFHKQFTINFGSNQPHNNVQPSRIALFIEPNFN